MLLSSVDYYNGLTMNLTELQLRLVSQSMRSGLILVHWFFSSFGGVTLCDVKIWRWSLNHNVASNFDIWCQVLTYCVKSYCWWLWSWMSKFDSLNQNLILSLIYSASLIFLKIHSSEFMSWFNMSELNKLLVNKKMFWIIHFDGKAYWKIDSNKNEYQNFLRNPDEADASSNNMKKGSHIKIWQIKIWRHKSVDPLFA